MVTTRSLVLALAASLATAEASQLPLISELNEEATAEAHQRDDTATREFSNIPIMTSDGRCLFVDPLSGDFRANLTPVQVAECQSTDGQTWDVITAGKHNDQEGAMLIVSTLTQACFNFDGRNGNVNLFSCGGRASGEGTVTDSQLFDFSGGWGPHAFKPRNTDGQCLAVEGDVVVAATCDESDPAQSFTFGGMKIIKSRHHRGRGGLRGNTNRVGGGRGRGGNRNGGGNGNGNGNGNGGVVVVPPEAADPTGAPAPIFSTIVGDDQPATTAIAEPAEPDCGNGNGNGNGNGGGVVVPPESDVRETTSTVAPPAETSAAPANPPGAPAPIFSTVDGGDAPAVPTATATNGAGNGGGVVVPPVSEAPESTSSVASPADTTPAPANPPGAPAPIFSTIAEDAAANALQKRGGNRGNRGGNRGGNQGAGQTAPADGGAAAQPTEAPVMAPVAEEPVAEPVAEEPVVETPAVVEPVVETPVVEAPVETPADEQPVAEEPVAEAPAPALSTVAVDEPAATTQAAAPTAGTGNNRGNNRGGNGRGRGRGGKTSCTSTTTAAGQAEVPVASSALATAAAESAPSVAEETVEESAPAAVVTESAAAESTPAVESSPVESAPAAATSAAPVDEGNGGVPGNPTEAVPVSRAGGTLNPTAAAEAHRFDSTATRPVQYVSLRTSAGQCVSVDPTAGDFRQNLIPLQLVRCGGTTNEKFDFITAGRNNNGSVRRGVLITSVLTNGCVSPDARRAADDNVTLFSCGGRAGGEGRTDAAQLVRMDVNADEFEWKVANGDGRCVVPGNGRLVLGACGGPEATFTVIHVGPDAK